jgi:NhaA family Na+:H+ antiporter
MNSTGPASRKIRTVVVDRFRRFLDAESASARLLAIAAIVALVWANSPLSASYSELWTTPLPSFLTFGGHIPDLKHLINDGAMTLFFLVVGLEIKRELINGELSSLRSAALPAVGALGGMILPALIYASLNAGSATGRGWGIPIATDIAFAVAVLVAFGNRIPTGLKVFLLSLAIVDDIGAIAAIAIFYAEDIQVQWLVTMGVIVASLSVVTRFAALRWWVIAPAGLALWLSAVYSGVHPTIAGVLLAFTMSIHDDEGTSVEDRLHPWTGLVVIPLFGLANTGVLVSLDALSEVATTAAGAGIVLGLVVGKIVGVSFFAWIAVKIGLGELPEGVTWGQVLGAAAAAGIGFTVSLFITDLAFTDPALAEAAKLAVFVGSLISAVVAFLVLRAATSHKP